MREKLIGLLDYVTRQFRFDAWENADKIADFLIANGVVIPVKCEACKYSTKSHLQPHYEERKYLCSYDCCYHRADHWCAQGKRRVIEEEKHLKE